MCTITQALAHTLICIVHTHIRIHMRCYDCCTAHTHTTHSTHTHIHTRTAWCVRSSGFVILFVCEEYSENMGVFILKKNHYPLGQSEQLLLRRKKLVDWWS